MLSGEENERQNRRLAMDQQITPQDFSTVKGGGSWTTKHIMRDLPGGRRHAYEQFHRAPCLMANVAVRNWRFVHKIIAPR